MGTRNSTIEKKINKLTNEKVKEQFRKILYSKEYEYLTNEMKEMILYTSIKYTIDEFGLSLFGGIVIYKDSKLIGEFSFNEDETEFGFYKMI